MRLALVHIIVVHPILRRGCGCVTNHRTLVRAGRSWACRQAVVNIELWLIAIAWKRLLLAPCCEVVELSIIIEFVFVIKISQLLKVDLVPQNGADTTETFHKLISLARSV